MPLRWTSMTHPPISEEAYSALVSLALEPILVINPEGHITFANDAAQKLVGRPSEDCMGRPLPELIHLEDRSQFVAQLDRALNTPGFSLRIRFRLRGRTGRWLSIEAQLRSARIGKGNLAFIHARDLTDGEYLEARLRHAQKLNLLGRLAAGMADDFEQVVSTIRGHLPSLMEQAAERPAMLGVYAIGRANEKAAMLTRQLRAFVETTPLFLEQVDVHAVLNEIRRSLSGELWLQPRLAAVRTLVRSDRAALTLGLRDLLSSIHFEMPDHSVIAVTTLNTREGMGLGFARRAKGDHLVIEVNNTGQKISSEMAERYVEQPLPDPSAGGVTLALVIIDDIVSSSGGWIEVATNEIGATAVRIFLPLD